jgi:hypothetical protein
VKRGWLVRVASKAGFAGAMFAVIAAPVSAARGTGSGVTLNALQVISPSLPAPGTLFGIGGTLMILGLLRRRRLSPEVLPASASETGPANTAHPATGRRACDLVGTSFQTATLFSNKDGRDAASCEHNATSREHIVTQLRDFSWAPSLNGSFGAATEEIVAPQCSAVRQTRPDCKRHHHAIVRAKGRIRRNKVTV